jgi:hypothetical protein
MQSGAWAMSARKYNIDCTEDIGRFLSGFNLAKARTPVKILKAWANQAGGAAFRSILRDRASRDRGQK